MIVRDDYSGVINCTFVSIFFAAALCMVAVKHITVRRFLAGHFRLVIRLTFD